jgi:hypothetical protein
MHNSAFFQKEWAYLNHGAFGAAIKEGLEAEMVRESQVRGGTRCAFKASASLHAMLKPPFSIMLESWILFYLQEWMKYTERQSVRFFDRELFPHLGHVIRRVAKFIGESGRCWNSYVNTVELLKYRGSGTPYPGYS